MKKTIIAAVAAAAMFGFGTVSTAMADVEISGFADINYNAFASEGEEGTFRASGEIDIIQTGDGATFRADFDLVNAHNSSPGSDLPTGTDALNGGAAPFTAPTGVDIEQLNFSVPLLPNVTVTAGIWNSPFGMEGQDATDIHFAKNGLLWNEVPSNMAGALASITLNDMISANVGFINSRSDITGILNTANDVVITATANVVDGVSVTVGYLTDEAEVHGDQLNIHAQIGLIEGVDIALEYLSADPMSGSGDFDNGYGLEASTHIGMFGVAVRYEADSAEGAGTEHDETSLAVAYGLSDDCDVRVDYTNGNSETSTGVTDGHDTVTIQLLHTF
jgi:hypothetical protein